MQLLVTTQAYLHSTLEFSNFHHNFVKMMRLKTNELINKIVGVSVLSSYILIEIQEPQRDETFHFLNMIECVTSIKYQINFR